MSTKSKLARWMTEFRNETLVEQGWDPASTGISYSGTDLYHQAIQTALDLLLEEREVVPLFNDDDRWYQHYVALNLFQRYFTLGQTALDSVEDQVLF